MFKKHLESKTLGADARHCFIQFLGIFTLNFCHNSEAKVMSLQFAAWEIMHVRITKD